MRVKYDHHHYDGDNDEKGDLDHSVMSLLSFQSSGTGSLWRGVSGPLQKVTKWGGKDFLLWMTKSMLCCYLNKESLRS